MLLCNTVWQGLNKFYFPFPCTKVAYSDASQVAGGLHWPYHVQMLSYLLSTDINFSVLTEQFGNLSTKTFLNTR